MSISATVQQVVQLHTTDVHGDDLSDGIGELWGGDDMGSGTDEDDSDGDMEEESFFLFFFHGSSGPGRGQTYKIRIVTSSHGRV